MDSSNKIKCWLDENKKYVRIGGTIVLSLAGLAFYKNKKIAIPEPLENWTMKQLTEERAKFLPEFHRTNVKPFRMQQLDIEIDRRSAQEWFAKHPPNFNSRWTDVCRWDKD